MWHLLYAIQAPDVVEGVDAGAKAAVKTEDLVINEGGKRKVVEEVGKVFPHVCVAILAQAFVVEAVDLSDLARLVIATKNGDARGIADLQGDEQSDCLHGIIATVDVIAYGIHRSGQWSQGDAIQRRQAPDEIAAYP